VSAVSQPRELWLSPDACCSVPCALVPNPFAGAPASARLCEHVVRARSVPLRSEFRRDQADERGQCQPSDLRLRTLVDPSGPQVLILKTAMGFAPHRRFESHALRKVV
jgi:hypothetical protein